MATKLIAIGSRLMGDDGIALEIAQKLTERLESLGIETIIGETDVSYCINQISEKDMIFILDSTQYGIKPGTITLSGLSEMECGEGKWQLQHDVNLAMYLNKYAKEVEAYIIGIEAQEIKLSLDLSDALKSRLDNICEEVYENIRIHIKDKAIMG